MPRPPLSQFIALRLVVAAPIAVALATAVAAQQTKRGHRSQPVPTSRAAPDMTGTIQAGRGKAAAPAPIADDETLPAPFNLPVAPRSRVRACGKRWQAIKLAGQAGADTWREYATKCLADNSDAAKTTAAQPTNSKPTHDESIDDKPIDDKAAASGETASRPSDVTAAADSAAANQRPAGPRDQQ